MLSGITSRTGVGSQTLTAAQLAGTSTAYTLSRWRIGGQYTLADAAKAHADMESRR
jgi:hypothetical protein